MSEITDSLFSALWGIEYLFIQKTAKEFPDVDKYGFAKSGILISKDKIEISEIQLEKLSKIAESRGIKLSRGAEEKILKHVSKGKEMVRIEGIPVMHKGMYLLVDAQDDSSQMEQTSLGYSYKELKAMMDKTPSQDFNIDLLSDRLKEKCKDQFNAGKFDDAVFNACKVVEVRTRELAQLENSDIGVRLMRKAFSPKFPILAYSKVAAEQQAIMELFSSFIGIFKNAQSHRFVNIDVPETAFEILVIANHLLKILDGIEENK